MGTKFKKLKFGFVNLTLDFLEKEDLTNATRLAEDAKNLLQKEMEVTIIESALRISSKFPSKYYFKQILNRKKEELGKLWVQNLKN